MAEKEEGRKQGRVESDINWIAWLAHQIMQVQETKIYRDVIVQLSSSSPAASSKRSLTDSFSKPNFAKLLVLPLQLCRTPGARSALQLATLHASSHRATPLLSYTTAAISCFSGSGAKQQLLRMTSTGSGKLSSKCHPVHCAKCHTGSWWPNQVRQNTQTMPRVPTACLDKRSLFNLTRTKTKKAEYE